jgi:hypothetical protein
MKRTIIRAFILFTTTLVVFSASLAAHTLAATVKQDNQGAATAGRLRLDSLERLATKANEIVNIEIDGFLMKFAGTLLSDTDADERTVKEIIAGLKGIYIRSYEFKSGGAFAEGDLAALREQLRTPGWSRVIDVKSLGAEFDDDEVYMATSGGRVEGLVLLDIQPKEVTVINIVGAIDLDKLNKLKGKLRLPHINITRKKQD